MPAVSQKQQKFMGMVLSAKRGKKPASPMVAKAAHSMTTKQAKEFAGTKRSKLPMKKQKMVGTSDGYMME